MMGMGAMLAVAPLAYFLDQRSEQWLICPLNLPKDIGSRWTITPVCPVAFLRCGFATIGPNIAQFFGFVRHKYLLSAVFPIVM
jgi:hypothetical protein